VIAFAPDEPGVADRATTPEWPLSSLSPFELEVARLIVETVHLEISPEAIDPSAPLFGEGLGLDSIDALESALAVSQRYGFELKSDDAENDRIFGSLTGLAAHIAQDRAG
jgi:acyl carrier protein